MKKLKIHLLLISVAICSADKLQSQTSIGYEFLLGGSFLSNTHLSANKPLSDPKTLSGSFMTFATTGKGAIQLKPGLGASVQTFGLNKTIERVSGRSVFRDFPAGQKYSYSYLQQVFTDVTLGAMYTLPIDARRMLLQMEAGVTAGYMVYSETQFSLKRNDENSVSVHSSNVKNLNPFRYGLYLKCNYARSGTEKNAWIIYSLSGNYYFNDLFTHSNYTPGKSFSVMIGAAVFINKKSSR